MDAESLVGLKAAFKEWRTGSGTHVRQSPRISWRERAERLGVTGGRLWLERRR